MSTKKLAAKPLQIRIWKTSQAAHYEQLAKLGKFKIRISIRRDSYDFQSYAVASVFDTAKLAWNNVYTIPYAKMASLKTVNPHGEPVGVNFSADVVDLIAGIQAILF